MRVRYLAGQPVGHLGRDIVSWVCSSFCPGRGSWARFGQILRSTRQSLGSLRPTPGLCQPDVFVHDSANVEAVSIELWLGSTEGRDRVGYGPPARSSPSLPRFPGLC